MTIEECEQHIEENDGYCTFCKEVTTFGGVEPDATGFYCEACNRNTVMGVEQALLEGKLSIED